MDQMQKDMLEKARAHRDENTHVAANFDEFANIIAEKQGFVKAMWCEDVACENKIKEATGATSRCMPFKQEKVGETCVCCGKPAKTMVYWAKAYQFTDILTGNKYETVKGLLIKIGLLAVFYCYL